MTGSRLSRLVRQAALPEITICQGFEYWVRETPDVVAVVCGNESVTYAELNARANRLAHFLIAQGIGPDSPVGICTERSIELVVGQLGVLKAGGVYVPLDADFPPERLAFMLEDTAPAVLLTQRHLLSALPLDPNRLLVCLDDAEGLWQRESSENPAVPLTPDHLAYIVYTSGSTGQPKGVALAHRGVVRLVRGQDYAPFRPEQRFLMLASPSFDGIIFELWGPLLNGACCVVFAERWPEADRLETVIREQGVTCLFLTTGLFNQIIDHRPEALRTVGTLLVGGEAHSVKHTQRALELLKDTLLVNGYGPTECTTFACAHRIGPRETWGCESVPIGGPINHTECLIVDEAMQVLPVGEAGELLLGGAGLAREYWRRPDLTVERFVLHPLPECAGQKLYRTGDRCRVLPNGTIEYLGRLDDQIKLRGYRIEPGEIERVLREYPGIGDTAVFVREHDEGRQLAAAIVAGPDGTPPAMEALRSWLQTRLPDFMVPVWFTRLEALPLTSNGKVNRRALSESSRAVRLDSPAEMGADGSREEALLHLWRRMLGDEKVGPEDNFFARGGDSLACMELAIELGRLLQRPVSVSWVHQAPTVAAMARKCASIVAHGGGPSLPLFQLPGLHGGSKAQAKLALMLSDRWQSYDTLVYPGARENRGELKRIEDFAAEMVRQIRRVRPTGPYALSGFSFGALVAYEVARQLTLSGEQVVKLVLWDPGLIGELGTEPKRQILSKAWGKVRRKVRSLFQPGGWQNGFRISALTRSQLKQPLRWILPRQRAIESLGRVPNWTGDFIGTALRAFATYRLGTYPGDVVLMQCKRENGDFAATAVWKRAVKGRLTIHRFDCPHDVMLKEPVVEEVLEFTRRELDA